MCNRLDRALAALPVILGVVTLAGVGVLLIGTPFNSSFPPGVMIFSLLFHWR